MNDASIKTGPSLYNLFLTDPRDREVIVSTTKKKATIKADLDYFKNSVRNSAKTLAIAETGRFKGAAYPAIMPQFVPQVVSDDDLESI